MSTRSRIAIMEKDGKIKSVYCHSEGYPTYQGALLIRHYNSEEKAREIISLGGLSLLDADLHPKAKAKPRYSFQGYMKGTILTQHSFEYPQAGVTIAYHRDRREPLIIAENDTLEEYEKSDSFVAVIYNYLWDGKWFVFDHYRTKQWLELTTRIVENGLR